MTREQKQAYWDKQPGYNGAAFSANGFDGKAGLDEEELLTKDPNWLKASKAVYEMAEGKKWPEDASDQELANWGADYMGYFNANLVSLGKAKYHSSNGTLEQKQGLLYLMQAYDEKNMSWDGMWRGVKGLATDPTTYVGLFSFGTLAAGVQATKFTAKALVTQLLTRSIQSGIQKQTTKFVFKDAAQVATAKVAKKTYTKAALTTAGGLSAVYGGLHNDARQTIKINAGQQAEYSYSELGWSTAISTALGVTTGGVFIVGGRVISNKLFPIANNIPQPNKAILESLSKAPDAKPFLDSAGNLTEGWWRNKAAADAVLDASADFLKKKRGPTSLGPSKKPLMDPKDLPFVQATAKLAADRALKNPNYTGNAIRPEVQNIVDKSVMASFKSIAIKDATKAPIFSTAGLAQNIKDIPSHISPTAIKQNAAWALGAKQSKVFSRDINGEVSKRVSIRWRDKGEASSLGQMMRAGLRVGSGGTLDTGGKWLGLQPTLLGKIGGVGVATYGLGTISGSDTLQYLGGNTLDLSTDLSPVKYYFSSDDAPTPAVEPSPPKVEGGVEKQNDKDSVSVGQLRPNDDKQPPTKNEDKNTKNTKNTPQKNNDKKAAVTPTPTPQNRIAAASSLESAKKTAESVIANAKKGLSNLEKQVKAIGNEAKYIATQSKNDTTKAAMLSIQQSSKNSAAEIQRLQTQIKGIEAQISAGKTLAGLNILITGSLSDLKNTANRVKAEAAAYVQDPVHIKVLTDAELIRSAEAAATKAYYIGKLDDFLSNSAVYRTGKGTYNEDSSDAAKILRNATDVGIGAGWAAWDGIKDSFNFMNKKDSLGGWGPIIMQLGAGLVTAVALKKMITNPVFDNTLGKIPVIGGFLAGTASLITSLGGGLVLGGALMGAYQKEPDTVGQGTDAGKKHALKNFGDGEIKTAVTQDHQGGNTKKIVISSAANKKNIEATTKALHNSVKSLNNGSIQGNPSPYMPAIIAMQQPTIISGNKRDDLIPNGFKQDITPDGTLLYVPNSPEVRDDDAAEMHLAGMLHAPEHSLDINLPH